MASHFQTLLGSVAKFSEQAGVGRLDLKRSNGQVALGPNGRFKGRQFTAEAILWAVRRYLMFPVSYRDLALMLLDRGVEVGHSTLFRWIQAYAPELERRILPHLRPSNGSWRLDETYIRVKGCWTAGPQAHSTPGSTRDGLRRLPHSATSTGRLRGYGDVQK
jgi:hypothetical protein